MNIIDAFKDLFSIGLFFFLTVFFSFLISSLAIPRTRLSIGPTFHIKGPLQYLSWWFYQIRVTRLDSKNALLILTTLSLLTLNVFSIPLFAGPTIFYGLPSLFFLVVYLVTRLIWAITMNSHDGESLRGGRRDYILVSAIILTIVFGALSFLKGGEQPFIFNQATPAPIKKVSSIILMVILWVSSGHFFIPFEGVARVSVLNIPHHISRSVWFFVLAWIFIGPVSQSFFLNYVFFLFATAVLMSAYEFAEAFLPQTGTKNRVALDEFLLLPIVVFGSMLVYLEATLL